MSADERAQTAQRAPLERRETALERVHSPLGAHDPIVWREAFNVIYSGPNLVNASFELPEAPQDCNNRTETFTPASDWTVRYWNKYLDELNPILNFRDDRWTGQGPGFNLPSCPPAERGLHYASTATYTGQGTGQWSQTLATTPGRKYTLSGWFGHSQELIHGTTITLSLLAISIFCYSILCFYW